MSEQEHFAHYESAINERLRTNFSKETAEDVSIVKDAEISALRFERNKNLDELKRLIEHGENPKHSEDDRGCASRPGSAPHRGLEGSSGLGWGRSRCRRNRSGGLRGRPRGRSPMSPG